MPMLLRHALLRGRAVLVSPAGLALVPVAALGTTVIWGLMVNLGPDSTLWNLNPGMRVSFWAFTVVTLWLWTWGLTLPFAGRGGQVSRVTPLPALPLRARDRALGEAAVIVLGVLLVFRAIWVIVGVYAVYHGGPLDPRSFAWSLLYLLVGSGVGRWFTFGPALLALPVILAWLVPARTDGTYYGRALLVAVLVCLAPVVSHGEARYVEVFVSLTLSFLVLASPEIPLTRSGRRGSVSGEASLVRDPLEPEARFQRDRWERLRPWVPRRIALALLALFGGVLLRDLAGLHGAVHALLVLVAFALLAPICVAPVGISVTRGDALSGRYAKAWAPLPVRPELVRRTVYLHGLLSATLVWLLLLAHALVVVALGLRWWPWPWHWNLLLVLVIPCVAGFLLCGAVGDRRRGYLSALALATFLPVHLGTLAGAWKADSLGITALTQDMAILLALAVLGGVPPLVHLRRERISG